MSITPPAGDQLSFTPSRELLNPKFESYKLSVPEVSDAVQQFALPGAGFQTRTLPDHARLAYSEVQARVRHNHLSTGKEGELVYIDADLRVVAFVLSLTGAPTFHHLVDLPQPVASSSSSRVPEYPDAIALSPSRWCISDGTGRLYVITVDKSDAGAWTGRAEGCYELVSDEGGELFPFRLHAADEMAGKGMFALLSIPIKVTPSSIPKPPSAGGLSTSARHKIPSTTAFEYLSVRIEGPGTTEDVSMEESQSKALEVEWRLHSHDLPSFVSFDSSAERYIIGAPSSLTSNPEGPSTPTAPSRAPSATPGGAQTPESNAAPVPRPPPFSWTQDMDSLTVVFALPSDTPTSSIRVTFSRQFLTLHIGSATSALNPSAPRTTLPHVSHKKLWDAIDPHTSVWTFDRESEGRDSTFGLLSLHLEKADAGVKWTDVFALTAPATDESTKITELTVAQEELELEHVVETLDPSELAEISENMEKYTKGMMEEMEVDGGGLGHGVPTSLIGEEIDVEVDGDSGRPLIVTWVENATTESPRLVRPHPTIPFSLLSTPLPLASPSDFAMSIKHDVDGLLFAPSSTSSTSYAWTHTSTFPALAFVLATKQDASFVHHLADRAVLAFDAPSNFSLSSPAGGTRSGAGNLFVYCRPPDAKGTKGVQMVLRVGGPSSGALVGVGGVAGVEGAVSVVALCENELVVFKVL